MSYGLSIGNTCPIIDNGINDARRNIDGYLDDLARELNPKFCDTVENFQEWLDNEVNVLYVDALEAIFENLRTTNSDLRADAEDQLSQANKEIEELQARIEELEND